MGSSDGEAVSVPERGGSGGCRAYQGSDAGCAVAPQRRAMRRREPDLETVCLIGQGSAALVYLVRSRRTGKMSALKVSQHSEANTYKRRSMYHYWGNSMRGVSGSADVRAALCPPLNWTQVLLDVARSCSSQSPLSFVLRCQSYRSCAAGWACPFCSNLGRMLHYRACAAFHLGITV